MVTTSDEIVGSPQNDIRKAMRSKVHHWMIHKFCF